MKTSGRLCCPVAALWKNTAVLWPRSEQFASLERERVGSSMRAGEMLPRMSEASCFSWLRKIRLVVAYSLGVMRMSEGIEGRGRMRREAASKETLLTRRGVRSAQR